MCGGPAADPVPGSTALDGRPYPDKDTGKKVSEAVITAQVIHTFLTKHQKAVQSPVFQLFDDPRYCRSANSSLEKCKAIVNSCYRIFMKLFENESKVVWSF